MDPFDEFEIKPLSEGLGFHKKPVELKRAVADAELSRRPVIVPPSQPSAAASAAAAAAAAAAGAVGFSGPADHPAPADPKQAFSDLLKALEKPVGKKAASIVDPLPQAASVTKKASGLPPEFDRPWGPNPNPAVPPAVKEPAKAPLRDAKSPLAETVQNLGVRRGAADAPMAMLERSPVSIPAGILDTVMTLALSLVFLVILMTITKVDLGTMLSRSGLDLPTKLAMATLFMSVWLMYVVVARSFFGRTLGEWTFDHQMGDDQQHLRTSYPFRVIWRSLLVLMTGVLTLPLLSLIFNRDLLSPLTGLQLYRQR